MKRFLGVTTAVVLGLAGCGGSSTKTVTITSSTSSASPSTSGTSPVPIPTGPATGSAGTTATGSTTASSTSTSRSAPAAPTLHLGTFRSPSGNIGCMIIAGTARCDIRQRSWSPPPRPAGCPNIVDFGQGLIVTRSGPGRFVCAGDTSLDPGARALPYNSDTLVDGFRCASRTNGITCTNTGNGHGFFIAIQGYRRF